MSDITNLEPALAGKVGQGSFLVRSIWQRPAIARSMWVGGQPAANQTIRSSSRRHIIDFSSMMRLSPLAQFIQSHVKILVHTGHSIVYTNRAEPNVVVKAEHIWIDGKSYDRAPSAENTSYHLSREAEIYAALGSHQHITKYFGLDYDEQGNAIALKTELASNGNLRDAIIQDAAPSWPRRSEIAVEFARAVQYLHSCGVIWGDHSTRNTLIFDDRIIKLCDFASSSLKGVYLEFGDFTYEPTYSPAVPEVEVDGLTMMQRELYALGSAIYEITEWKRPYAEFIDRQDVDIWSIVESGIMPKVAEDNVAQNLIVRCWAFKYESARAIAADLAALCQQQKE